ncbi:interleukin-1 receptor-associated kinase 1-binding protein 1 isoform X2 [Myotis daubentonii]|uniref:interleukin-1 receptor-associated kinase 1-binding protein 1 isoform X2 n=1 Tax=Myotis daubentonii TaxID=98922 RepID=UPI0028732F31|nr:interleukin-1 receptor-associated kinase 1-binding protein 1 isoform X2 [Myotis daubentonii]
MRQNSPLSAAPALEAPAPPSPSRQPLRRAQGSPGALWPLRPPSAPSCYGNPAAITMSLPQASRSRMFVELVPWADRSRENNLVSGGETLPIPRHPLSSAQAQTSAREVHVSGAAEVSASPDRAQVAVRVSSTKEAAAEAKKSVCRRLDYITQSLQQQGLQAENVTVTKDFRRVENAYHMEAEGPLVHRTHITQFSTCLPLSQPQQSAETRLVGSQGKEQCVALWMQMS